MPDPQVLTAGGAAKMKDTSNSNAKRRSRKKQHQTTPFDAEDAEDLLIQNDAPAEVTLEEQDEESKPAATPPSIKKTKEESSFVTTTLPEPNLEELERDDAAKQKHSQRTDLVWLLLCFLGIMASFVCYGLLLEYTTSGGRHLHELSFLFVTSGLYTVTAAAGRYVRDETPTTIPPARFAILGLTSMGSTFCSVRSLRYVIYPIQVLAKSCKPVPVMIMGAFMGKKYPLRKYLNVCLIVMGVALFMGGYVLLVMGVDTVFTIQDTHTSILSSCSQRQQEKEQ